MLLEILYLYFKLRYHPVLLFLCHYACSPQFLLFHLNSFFVYKGPVSVLRKGIFLGKKGVVKKFIGAPPPGAMAPKIFPARTAPEFAFDL